LKKHKIQLITNSNIYKLRNHFAENVVPALINLVYVRLYAVLEGAITVILDSHAERFVEHRRAYKNNHPDLSAVAYQMFFDEYDQKRRYQHEFDFFNLKLVQSVANQRKLDFLETFYSLKNKHHNLMNKNEGSLESPLFDIFIKATIRKLLYSFSQCDISIEIGDIVTEIFLRK
jgi:hypothetical protein